MLLAAWYKHALKESLLSKIYANKAKVKGVEYTSTVIPAKAGIQSKDDIEGIYHQYLQAYKKGVFNFIKEDVDKYTNEAIPRKYFSGGAIDNYPALLSRGGITSKLTLDQSAAMVTEINDRDDLAQVAAEELREVRLPDAAMNVANPYSDVQSMYTGLPKDIVKLMVFISQNYGFTDSFGMEEQDEVKALMAEVEKIYRKMGLLTENYHNHLHNMSVTYGALLMTAKAGLIKNKEDLLVTFLAALFHDFHVRETEPKEHGQPASAAYVHETLGVPGSDKGGQLRDLFGIEGSSYKEPAPEVSANAIYKTVTEENKTVIRNALHMLF